MRERAGLKVVDADFRYDHTRCWATYVMITLDAVEEGKRAGEGVQADACSLLWVTVWVFVERSRL